DEHALFAKLLQLTERNRLGSSTLNDLFNTEGTVFLLPAGHELLCVVRVEAEAPNIVLACLDVRIEIVVDVHHVEDSAVHYEQTTLSHELLVLVTNSSRQLRQRKTRDVASSLDSEPTVAQREEKCERTEVVTLREVRAKGAGELPERTLAVRLGFLVCEEVRVPLHRDSEALCKDVVAGSGSFLGSFDIQMVRIVGYGLADVRLSLNPHGRIVDFLDVVQFVVPDRDVRRLVLALENVSKFHFDCVAGTVSDSSLRADSNDQPVIKFGSTLFNSSNYIFSEISRQPFVDC